MAALNVEFDDDELEAIRQAARDAGMTMKAFVRRSTAEVLEHSRALKEGAAELQRVFNDQGLADAITAAGIDDGPTPTAAGRAA
ncbi:hypothetical protein [Streptomyces sp. NBC_00467]|uniref:hypothetical protein n=1 Tax=Streptomyces sp. NBC_00467 TaxID=2975752 RepID=UPI002E17237A